MRNKLVRLTEGNLKRIIKESVRSVLRESTKGADTNNIVPADVAEEHGFKVEYSGFENGLELWGRYIDKGSAKRMLQSLGITRFTTYRICMDGNLYVRITVKPLEKQDMDYPEYSEWGFKKPKRSRPMQFGHDRNRGKQPWFKTQWDR